MSWGLPSGNHLIWIRPHFQQVAQKYREAGQKAKDHKISILEAAVEATHWGDEQAGVDVKTWFSVAYDPDQNFWVARSNPDICQGFMRARTGSAEKKSEQLWLSSPGIRVEGPALALLHYQYATEATAKLAGNAMRGMTFDSEGAQKDWAGRTRFVRQLDMSAMTPQERLLEMLEAAVRDKGFASEMKKEFGVLGDPMFLLTMGAVFGVFIGVGAGAYLLGGAAFAAAISRLLGVAMIGMQIKSYVDLFAELQRCCFSEKQEDFVKGAKCVQTILCTAVRDIALLVTMEGALKIGAKAAGMLKTLFLRHAPMKWIEAANAGRAEAEALLARVKVRKYGYVGEQLLKRVSDEGKYFRRGEGSTYRAKSIRNGEMIALREVSSSRMGILDGLSGWARGKPEWAKLKSWHGKWGIAGFRSTSEASAIVKAQPKSTYPLGMLKGVNSELDALIAKHPTVDCYEVPYDQEVLLNFERDPNKPVKMKSGFDWGASGKKSHPLAKGFKLIDLGDHFLLVDPLGDPVIQDVDIASIYKTKSTVSGGKIQGPGTHSGSHSQRAGKPGNIEDDFVIEEMENYHLFESNGEIYDPNKHGGASGSTGHGENNLSQGKKGWTPLHDDGSFDQEKILVFLPYRSLTGDVTHAGLKCDLFEFAGWKEYLQFCEANNIRMPWNSSGKNNAALRMKH